jgi:hypothetical protein
MAAGTVGGRSAAVADLGKAGRPTPRRREHSSRQDRRAPTTPASAWAWLALAPHPASSPRFRFWRTHRVAFQMIDDILDVEDPPRRSARPPAKTRNSKRLLFLRLWTGGIEAHGRKQSG